MRIAMPVANGKLCMHFGHSERFAVVEADEAGRTAGEARLLEPPPHEPGVLPRWLHAQGVDVVIAGGMGRRAQSLFARHGVRVVTGAPAEAPGAVASAYLAGTLATGENACDH